MNKSINKKDILRLRELAKKQLEYANLPLMAERALQWQRNNDGERALPPVVVETWTFNPDMMPESVLECEDPKAREIEYHLLKNIREYELINDDKVINPYYPLNWKVDIDWFGMEVNTHHGIDSSGRDVGFAFDAPIKDLEQDFNRLKPVSVQLDREGTCNEKNLLDEVLDGILPVKIQGIVPHMEPSAQAVSLCGMEKLWIFILDVPEAVKALMDLIGKNHRAVMDFYEKEGLLTSTSGNADIGQSSYGFTKKLPGESASPLKLSDVWLFLEMEETSSVSPEMYEEFFLPYGTAIASPAGAVYYGCCEPLHINFPVIKKNIPQLRKISVSPWCDEEKIGELLQGTGVVYSRKPRATYLGIVDKLDEEAWRAHIAKSFKAARGGPCEVIMRDIYQVQSLRMVQRAVDIVREERLKYYG